MMKKLRETPMTMSLYKVVPMELPKAEDHRAEDTMVTFTGYRVKHPQKKRPDPVVSFRNYRLKA